MACARDETLRWYCVRTGYQAELLADLEIRNAGFTLFAPSLWKPATRARRNSNGSIRPAKPDRIVPLFPRYLFVQFSRADHRWRGIKELDGVDYLFSTTPETPVAVPDQAIERIRAKCAANGCVYPDNVSLDDLHAAQPLEIGVSARVLHGPMVDLTGFCQWSDGKRVRLLLEIMGGVVPVTVAQSAVEVV